MRLMYWWQARCDRYRQHSYKQLLSCLAAEVVWCAGTARAMARLWVPLLAVISWRVSPISLYNICSSLTPALPSSEHRCPASGSSVTELHRHFNNKAFSWHGAALCCAAADRRVSARDRFPAQWMEIKRWILWVHLGDVPQKGFIQERQTCV